MNTSPAKTVSNERDLVVLVDSNDNEIGLRDKRSTHEGRGILHRAISVFLFNDKQELLLAQRHEDKPLWGGFWSNSCCTHPYFKESTQHAAERRVLQELGLETQLEFVYKFEYRAEWSEEYAEHELCSVFVGYVVGDPVCNETEVKDWQWIKRTELEKSIREKSLPLTPWMLLEWEELCQRGIA